MNVSSLSKNFQPQVQIEPDSFTCQYGGQIVADVLRHLSVKELATIRHTCRNWKVLSDQARNYKIEETYTQLRKMGIADGCFKLLSDLWAIDIPFMVLSLYANEKPDDVPKSIRARIGNSIIECGFTLQTVLEGLANSEVLKPLLYVAAFRCSLSFMEDVFKDWETFVSFKNLNRQLFDDIKNQIKQNITLNDLKRIQEQILPFIEQMSTILQDGKESAKFLRPDDPLDYLFLKILLNRYPRSIGSPPCADAIKLGKKIELARNEFDLTQERFGQIIGTTQKNISQYETGNFLPPLAALRKIAKTLKKPFAYFLDE